MAAIQADQADKELDMKRYKTAFKQGFRDTLGLYKNAGAFADITGSLGRIFSAAGKGTVRSIPTVVHPGRTLRALFRGKLIPGVEGKLSALKTMRPIIGHLNSVKVWSPELRSSIDMIRRYPDLARLNPGQMDKILTTLKRSQAEAIYAAQGANKIERKRLANWLVTNDQLISTMKGRLTKLKSIKLWEPELSRPMNVARRFPKWVPVAGIAGGGAIAGSELSGPPKHRRIEYLPPSAPYGVK